MAGTISLGNYGPAEAAAFLADLAALAGPLGLTVVGVRRSPQPLSLEELRGLAASRAGQAELGRVHLRIYTAADYLERWARVFQGGAEAALPAATGPPDVSAAAVLADMAARGISRRALAAGLKQDFSFLSKVLAGSKPAPAGLLAKARVWVAEQQEPTGQPTPPLKAPLKHKHTGGDTLLGVALALRARGWSAVPQLPGAKKPCVRWKPFQDRLPTQAQLAGWFKAWPGAGLALVLGPVSGVFVIDVDGREAHDALVARLDKEPVAPKVLSGSGDPFRYHLYFRCPSLPTKAKQTPWHPQLEFRGHRGIVILPPSLHKSGKRYAWAPGRSPDDLPLPEVPPPVLQALLPARPATAGPAKTEGPAALPATLDASRHTRRFLSGADAEGPGWNERLFTAACDLCGRGVPLEVAEPLLLAGARPWNLGEEEQARSTVASAYSQPRVPSKF
jgi:hypothetical protein